MRNGPDTSATLILPLNSDVRVWGEGKGWKGPYKLLNIEGETCTINMPSGPVKFRSTVVKPYLSTPIIPIDQDTNPENMEESERMESDDKSQQYGSKNEAHSSKTKNSPDEFGTIQPEINDTTNRRYSLRNNRNHANFQYLEETQGFNDNLTHLTDQFLFTNQDESVLLTSFISSKEVADLEISRAYD